MGLELLADLGVAEDVVLHTVWSQPDALDWQSRRNERGRRARGRGAQVQSAARTRRSSVSSVERLLRLMERRAHLLDEPRARVGKLLDVVDRLLNVPHLVAVNHEARAGRARLLALEARL